MMANDADERSRMRRGERCGVTTGPGANGLIENNYHDESFPSDSPGPMEAH